MKYYFYLVICSFCVLDATTKTIYRYDPADDCVKNRIVENPSYGDSNWSYQYDREDSTSRALRFKESDIVGKSIMEFGCNDGGVLLACKALGASKVIGIEYNKHCIKRAEDNADRMGISRSKFLLGDMENKAFLANLPEVDTVFLLAILDTSEFCNKTAVIANISRFAKHAMYYEGHETHQSHVERMYDFLMATDFTCFEYLGRFEGRILMRFSRKLLRERDLTSDVVTSDSSDEELLNADEIYVFTDSPRNPPFSKKCRRIQFVKR